MWQLDVAPSPFLPHRVTHFLPRFPFFLTLSSTSFCSLGGGAWSFWFPRIACAVDLRPARLWCFAADGLGLGPQGGSGMLPVCFKPWVPSVTVPWREAPGGL